MCQDAPDTSKSDATAADLANLSKDQFEWVKTQFEASAPERALATKTAQQVSEAQLKGMNTATQMAEDYDQYNKSVYRPLERSIVADAQNFDTEAERERLAGLAVGDVNQSFANAREQGVRDLTRHGVNPNDGAYGQVAKELALGQSLAGADAATKSRQQSMTLGRALKMDAASLGRGLPSQQATQAGLALTAGSNSANTAQIPGQITTQGVNMVSQGAGNAVNGLNSAGNIYGSSAKARQTDDSGTYAGIGTAVGGIAMAI